MAGEKGVMHCFAFTPQANATQADWEAFYKASDQMPQRIKGVKSVWYGKLMRPLAQYSVTDPEARKKVMAEGKGSGAVGFTRREHGMCIWFNDEASFSAYANDPFHKEWEQVYGKVRVPGTTTYQIIGH